MDGIIATFVTIILTKCQLKLVNSELSTVHELFQDSHSDHYAEKD